MNLREQVERIFEYSVACRDCRHFRKWREAEHLSGRATAYETLTACDLLDPPGRNHPLPLEYCPGLEGEEA